MKDAKESISLSVPYLESIDDDFYVSEIWNAPVFVLFKNNSFIFPINIFTFLPKYDIMFLSK